MEGRTWSFLYKTDRGHHCSCFGSRTWKSGVHEAADFTSRFKQKIQNKQTQNDYQKAFSIYTAGQNIKDPFKALLTQWKRPSRNRCGLSSRHSRMGFYQQIINRPQWFWGHLNKLIQRWLLLLGIMISGSSFIWIMRAIYTSNTLCWSHFISADTWDIFPLAEHSVVWYFSYFHNLKRKQNNKTIEALQIIITEKTGKHPESENIWNVVEDCEVRVLKRLIFILLTCYCLLGVIARIFCTKSFLLSCEARHMRVGWTTHLLVGSLLAHCCPSLLVRVQCHVPWGLGLPVSRRTASNDKTDYFCKS